MDGEGTVVVFAGGDPDPNVRDALPRGARVVAADSGLHHAQALDLHVDVVVGDLDSVDEHALVIARERGTRVEQYPPDKDYTDLELALHAAGRLDATRVLVLATGGGRVDHFLANLLLLASPDFAALRIEAIAGDARVTVVRDAVELAGEPGSLLTLLAVGGPARGVRTGGLRYPLHGEELLPGSTRGVSNEFLDHRAQVMLDDGALLAIQPTGARR
jgi:thiamine pyrophosphokinase